MRKRDKLVSFFVVALFPTYVIAAEPTDPKSCTDAGRTWDATNKKCNPKPASTFGGNDAFRGLHWGIGAVYTPSLGGVGKVTGGAGVPVHVSQQNDSAARAAFELHYFFPVCGIQGGIRFPRYYSDGKIECGGYNNQGPVRDRMGTIDYENSTADKIQTWGIGPYVSLNSPPTGGGSGGTSQTFSSFGAGVMVGFNAFDSTDPNAFKHSVNFAAGLLVDTNVRHLAPGVVNGQVSSLAANDLTVGQTRTGMMFMLSYQLLSFNIN